MEELIMSQIQALEATGGSEGVAGLSFQEYNQQEVVAVYRQYFCNLRQAYLASPDSKLLPKLLEQYTLLGNSLWSQCQQILTYTQNAHKASQSGNPCILLSHSHYQSQSPLLALYCKMMGHRVGLTGSKGQIKRGWAASTVRMGEVDKVSGFKSVMAGQGVDVGYFQDQAEDRLENIDAQTDKEKLNIQIIDLFNTHPTVYKPYLLSHTLSKPTPNKTLIFYIHPTQSPQLLSLLPTPTPHLLQFTSSFPFESTTIPANKFEHELTIFLHEELNYPNKQDVIVFCDHQEEVVKRVRNLVKRDGGDLVKHTHVVAKANQNRRECLPPPPSFLTRMVSLPSPTKQPTKQNQASKISQPKSQISQPNSQTSQLESKPSLSPSPSSSPKQIHTHNNIFITPNFPTLMQWGYDLSHVFYIFDFRTDRTFHFDYELMTYVDMEQEFVSEREAGLRVSCMGVQKIGKYCVVVGDGDGEKGGERVRMEKGDGVADRRCKDIGAYCLEMINGGYKQFWEEVKMSREIRSCVEALAQAEIIKKEQGGTYSIVRTDVLKCVRKVKDLNPIMCAAILDAKNGKQQHEIAPSKLAILLAMANSIMMTAGCLRQTTTSNNSVANRPTQIWRQSGYLHSCIDLLVRAKIIEHREHQISQGKKSKKSVSRRMSKTNSQEWDVFGNLFEIIMADRITFDQMKVEDLLREELVNQAIFHTIVDLTEKVCDVLELEDFVFSSFDDINFVLADLLKFGQKAVGAYSGSRRVGYLMKGQADGIFANKASLLNVLNEHPHFVYATRLIKYSSLESAPKYEILMCNSIPEMTLMETIGMLPTRKTNSYGETQIEYHGVASATFKSLWRNNGADITAFQEKHGCFVEPNEEIALISIHCPKDKEKQVKEEFNNLMTKIKEKMATETKIVHYLGTTSLLFGTGCRIVQVIKDKYINKCSLVNLDLEVTVEDLQQLFEQFFHLKDIKVVRQPASASFKTAYIEFHSQKDYYRFHEYFNECLYMNRYLRVLPIESIPASSSLKQQMYLEFIWTAWKSNGQAIVEFQDEESCGKCMDSLKQTKFDGKLVKVQLRNGNKVYMSGLNVLTDEINLEISMEVFGKVKSIQILKTPLKENLKSLEFTLEDEIRKNVKGVLDIDVKKAEKLKNGLRKCRVVYKNEAKLNQTLVAMNEKIGMMGVGRLHIKSWFSYPIKVAHGYLHLYQQLVEVALKKLPNNRIKIQNSIQNEQEYIIGRSNLKQEIDLFKQNINSELQGYDVPLTGYESAILLTEVGIRNLIDLQEKYNCRLVPDFTKKTLIVLALLDNVKAIKQEVKAKVQDNFFYRVSLNQKSFKHFKQNPELCETLKKQYSLAEFELEEVGRNLLLEGSANHVEKAFNYLMHLIEALSKPTEQQKLNADTCGICCLQPSRSYRLQQCGHKFCLPCMAEYINSALGDMTMFPFKCPHCGIDIAIIDMDELLTPDMWLKTKNMALNQYVGRNPEIISSCFTAGCKQVNFTIKNYFSCDECQQSYCLACKFNYHPGLTCKQAQEGGNAAFQKYMKQNGIRKCPNQSCKMPIMRTDGCYRVTCSRCNKSMCFKCEPEKMIAYDHYNDCYKHLTDVHGGYW